MWGEIDHLFGAEQLPSIHPPTCSEKVAKQHLRGPEQVSPAIRRSPNSTAFPWRLSQTQNLQENAIRLHCGMIYVYIHVVGECIHIKICLMSIKQTCPWWNIKRTTDCSNSEMKLFSYFKLTAVPRQQRGWLIISMSLSRSFVSV